jgi:hypothetical protein
MSKSPTSATGIAMTAGGKAAARAAPWALSLLVHACVAVGLSFTGLVIMRGSSEAEIIVPDARLSDTPGGRMFDGTNDQPAAMAGQTAGKFSPAAASDFTAAGAIIGIGAGEGPEGDAGEGAQLIGIGGGAPMALTGLGAAAPQSPAGPVTKFFGTGGNAHHIVYLVDWSGSMYAEGRYQAVQMELLRSLGQLQPSQDFHILYFSQGAPLEVPPGKLVVARDEQRAAAGRFMRDHLGSPSSSAQGPVTGTDPVPALRRAFESLRRPPTGQPGKLIYLLTDGDFANNQAVLAELQKLNRARDVHINTILYATSLERTEADSAQRILSAIAAAHGGTFRWVKVDE